MTIQIKNVAGAIMSASRNTGIITGMAMHTHAVLGSPLGLVNDTVCHQYCGTVSFYLTDFDTDLIGGGNPMSPPTN